jgi:hypothetical protein
MGMKPIGKLGAGQRKKKGRKSERNKERKRSCPGIFAKGWRMREKEQKLGKEVKEPGLELTSARFEARYRVHPILNRIKAMIQQHVPVHSC